MKKALSIVLVLLVIITFSASLMAKESDKVEKVAGAKGTIVSVEEKEGVTFLTIQLKKGEVMTFYLAEGCEIKMRNKDISIAEIEPEMRVRVTYYRDVDMLVATKIKVSSRKLDRKEMR